MSSIRVKLVFERPLVKSPEQCWMLVDKSCCKLVRDLEYLIVKKFFVAGHTIVNLYLDDFLLPSQEKIDVIRDNDIIRVVEEKNHILSNEKSRKRTIKEMIRSSTKRKHEESTESKTKVKKAKVSPCKKIDKNNVKPDSTTDNQSSSFVVTKSDSTTMKASTVTNTVHKQKNKNLEIVNKTSHKDSGMKVNSKTKTRTKQKQLKKQQKKPLTKDKSIALKWNNFWDKLAGNRQQSNPTSNGEKVSCLECEKAPTNVGNGNDLSLVAIDKGTDQHQTVSKVQEKNEDALQLSKAKVTKGTSNRILNGIPQTSQGNHIRFDNEENASTDVLNDAMLPITHPRVLSIRGAATPSPNGTPNLSPIEPNSQNPLHVNKSVNGDDLGKKQRRDKGDKRKDSYTNRSLILESTRVGKETQRSPPVTVSIAENDFSGYPLLLGPPRVGDRIAYKVIELSQSYTPEISRYKEGHVLYFDSLSKLLRLQLTKESLTKVKGDGNVSSKFEIFENNGQDNEPIATEEISDEVEIQWTSMIEPRLVSAPITRPGQWY